MNIIAHRQMIRTEKIEQIKKSIKKARTKGEISYDDILLATMSNLNLSRRTAREYIDVALFALKLKHLYNRIS